MIGPEDLPELRDLGIAAVLSLTIRSPFPDGPPPGLRHAHLPVPDMSAPSGALLGRAVSFLREELEADHAVLVHCGAGLGRTGTVIACYLVSEGVDPVSAMRLVRLVRPGSIETEEQEEAVRAFVWPPTGEEQRG
jgi:atypical dual specificity phosphatase